MNKLDLPTNQHKQRSSLGGRGLQERSSIPGRDIKNLLSTTTFRMALSLSQQPNYIRLHTAAVLGSELTKLTTAPACYVTI
jgi:hypothetical protein